MRSNFSFSFCAGPLLRKKKQKPYAVTALVAVCLYVPTVAIVVPSFIQNLDGSSEIQFTGAYTLLETTFKLILVLSKTFSGSSPVYLACAVLTSSADLCLLLHKKWEFAKCSIWYFTKFKAFFSSLVLCSALVSLVAGELPVGAVEYICILFLFSLLDMFFCFCAESPQIAGVVLFSERRFGGVGHSVLNVEYLFFRWRATEKEKASS